MVFQRSGERSDSDSQASGLPAVQPPGDSPPPQEEGRGRFSAPAREELKRRDVCVREDGPASIV